MSPRTSKVWPQIFIKEKFMQKRSNGNNRLDRINEELKRELSNIINYEVKNSNVTGTN